MNLNWVQGEGSIEAKTLYGTYRITARLLGPSPIIVSLSSDDPSVSFYGEHKTITAAEKSAQDDHDYRTHIWETL